MSGPRRRQKNISRTKREEIKDLEKKTSGIITVEQAVLVEKIDRRTETSVAAGLTQG